jgi:hypothetical protein
MHFVYADCVVSRPLAVIQALAQGEGAFVECSSDGQVGSLVYCFVPLRVCCDSKFCNREGHEGKFRMQDYIQALSRRATTGRDDLESSAAQNAQTKRAFAARITLQLQVMRAIQPILCSLLRSWTVLPSGL